MANVFDKYKKGQTATPAAQKSGNVFAKYKNVPVQTAPQARIGETKTSYLPEFLGGGSYNTKIGEPNTLVNSGRSNYGGLATKTGYERGDVVPVSLGGVNKDIRNIKYQKNLDSFNKLEAKQKSGAKLTEQEKQELFKITAEDKYLIEQVLPDYKAGKISLPQARLKQISYQQKLADEAQGVVQGTKENLLSGLKDVFLHPVQSVKNAINYNQQTAQNVKGFSDSLNPKLNNVISNTVEDYTKTIKSSWDNAVDKISNAAIVSKDAPKSEKIGKTFEAWASIAGLGFSPITAAFEASKNLPVIGSIASAVNLPLSVAGDSAKNITNEGLNALVYTGKIKKETAENIRQGVNEVINLSVQIIVGGKMFEEKGLLKKKEELIGKYGKQDAETIIRKAEEKARLETQPAVASQLSKEQPLTSETKPANVFDKYQEQPNLATQSTPEIIKPKEVVAPKETPKIAKKPKEVVYKPIEEVIAKTPEIKTSKLALGVESKAISKKLTQGFEELPEYAKVNIEQQAKASSELVKKRLNESIEIAKGNRLPPEGILPESVFVAVEQHAIKTKDVNLLQDLAKGSLTTQATGMGQRLRILAERNPDSPVTRIKEVSENRQKSIEEKTGKKIGEIKKGEINNIKKEIAKSKPTKDVWVKFVKEITC